MVLILLAIIIAVLAALAVVAVAVPQVSARVVALGSAASCGFAITLVLAALIIGFADAPLVLPIGPPSHLVHFALDPLSACFLLLVAIGGVPCAIAATVTRAAPSARLATIPISLAAMLLTLLAADAFTLFLGLMLLGLARWATFPSRSAEGEGRRPPASPSQLTATIFGIGCLIVASALASASVSWLGHDFTALRGAPPEGWRSGAILFFGFIGVGAIVLHEVSPPYPPLDQSTALSAGLQPAVGLYVLIRLLFDLAGPIQPPWWGVTLIVVGAVVALSGSMRAVFAAELDSVLSIGALHQVGLTLVCLGAALLARSVDLPSLAAVARDAAWLQITGLALCRTLLLLCAAAARDGAGTRHLDRLGGLIHRMPVTAACILVGLFGAIALPPGLGFAGLWLLFQSLLGAARSGGFALQLLLAAVVALVGLSIGLAAFSAVRVFGIAFLGRPRAPRTAAAEEPGPHVTLPLIGLATLIVLLGLFPGLAVLPAREALSFVEGTARNTQSFALLLTPGGEMPGYMPLPIAALLLIAGGVMRLLLRRFSDAGDRREPAWAGGFAPPPPWLPFGDPATQYSAGSFSEPLRQLAPDVINSALPARLRLRTQAARFRFVACLRAPRALHPVIAMLGILVGVLVICLLAA